MVSSHPVLLFRVLHAFAVYTLDCFPLFSNLYNVSGLLCSPAPASIFFLYFIYGFYYFYTLRFAMLYYLTHFILCYNILCYLLSSSTSSYSTFFLLFLPYIFCLSPCFVMLCHMLWNLNIFLLFIPRINTLNSYNLNIKLMDHITPFSDLWPEKRDTRMSCYRIILPHWVLWSESTIHLI